MQKTKLKRLPPLTALRTFEVMARHQQLKVAAEELFVTPSAVSRQIKVLEDHIGVALFSRDKRPITLTDTGRQYAEDLRRIFDELFDATERVIVQNDRPTLHIRTSMMSFTQRWLMPRLWEFQEQCGDLDIQLTSADTLSELDFDRNPVDVGITRKKMHKDGLVSEALMPELLVVVCSPALLERQPLATLSDLKHHRIITTTSRPEIWPHYIEYAMKMAQLRNPEPESAQSNDQALHESNTDTDNFYHSELQLAHFFMTLEAAVSGAGVAALPLRLVMEELTAGRLVAPFNYSLPSGETYYAVYRKNTRQHSSIQQFVQWLKAQAESSACQTLPRTS